MYTTRAHDGEATGLAACAESCSEIYTVQLRPGAADVVVALVRWVLAVVGLVAVLWAGSVVLAAPASAAVVVPAAASASAGKSGKESSSGGDKKPTEKKSSGGEKKSTEKKSTEKKPAAKKPAQKSAAADKKTPPAAGKKTPPVAGKKTPPATDKKTPPAAGKKTPSVSGKTTKSVVSDGKPDPIDAKTLPARVDKNGKPQPTVTKPAVTKPAVTKPAVTKKPTAGKANDAVKDATKIAADIRGTVGKKRADLLKRAAGWVAKARAEIARDPKLAAKVAELLDRAGVKHELSGSEKPHTMIGHRCSDGVRECRGATSVDDAVQDATKIVAGLRGTTGKQRADLVKQAVRWAATVRADVARDPKAAAKVAAVLGKAGVKHTLQRVATDAVQDATKIVAGLRGTTGKQRAALVKQAARWAEEIQGDIARDPKLAAKVAAVLDKAGVKHQLAVGEKPHTMIGYRCSDGSFGGRDCAGTPSDEQGRPEGRGPPSGADSAEEQDPVEKALDGRIAVQRGKDGLAADKKDLASGKIDAKTYAQRVLAQRSLEKRVAADSAQLSTHENMLVGDVVAGHRAITAGEAALAADRKLLAAGKMSAATYRAHSAALAARKATVYAATDALSDKLGNSASDGRAEPLDKDGVSAGCDRSGAIVDCSTASKAGTASAADRCLALAGISSGCSASSGTGTVKAAASCVLTGAKQGCSSSATFGKNTASSSCAGSPQCAQRATATATDASTTCRTGAGTCTGATTGPPMSAKVASNVTTASCTGRCGIDGRVDARTADTDCRADNGTCSVRGVGRGVSGGTSSCRIAGGTCVAKAGARYENGILSSNADATVDCRADVCKGATDTAARGAVRGVAAAGKPVPVRATTTTSRCTITAGDCSSQAASDVTTVAGKIAGTRDGVANSSGGSDADCARTTCAGGIAAATSGAATGDVNRASGGTVGCTVHGAGGTCETDTDTKVTVQSFSTVDAKLACTGGEGTCGGTATGEVVAVDKVVSSIPRGARGSVACSVTGGTCDATTGGTSTTSRGGSAQATADSTLDCPDGCTGTATAGTTAFVGTVATKSSSSGVSCTLDGGACGGTARSAATTSGSAATLLSDSATVALPTVRGPILSSMADATMTIECADGCTGGVTTIATGFDGKIKRSSSGAAGCTNDQGDCRGSSRSVASGAGDVATLLPALPDGQQQVPGRTPSPTTVTGGAAAGPSGFSDSFALADCPEGCTGGAYSRTTGANVPGLLMGEQGGAGARGPPSDGTSSSSGTCTATDPCRVQTQSSAGTGAGVKYLVERNAANAAEGSEKSDESEKKPASKTAPPPLPVTMSQSGVYAECGGPQCTGNTVSDAITSGAGDAARSVSHSTGRCRSESGCGTGSDALAATTADTGLATPPVKGKKATWIPGVAGTTQAGSTLDCPQGCDGAVTGNSTSAAGPDGGASAALQAVRNGSKLPAKATRGDPVGTSRVDASTACTQSYGPCQAGVVTGAQAVSTPNRADRFATTGAFSSTGCAGTGVDGGKATCPTRSVTTSTGTNNPTTLGRPGVVAPAGTAKMVSSATCTASTCSTNSGSFAADGMGEATAGCTGAGCHAGTTGRATAVPTRGVLAQMAKVAAAAEKRAAAKAYAKMTPAQKAAARKQAAADRAAARKAPKQPRSTTAIKGGHLANAGSSCTATGTQTCSAGGQVGATPQGAQAGASCTGSKTCRFVQGAYSRASDAFRGNRAGGAAACASRGGVGNGSCATMAIAETDQTQALSGAACQGSKGTSCRFAYRSDSAAGSRSRNAGATAIARGFGAGKVGGGNVVTSAFAATAPGQAMASASCFGSKGTTCRYAYKARASQTVKRAGNRASATAVGWKSGRSGGGGIGVAVQAQAGPGYAAASTSCAGAGTCRRSYSAKASAADSYGGNKAWASASGKGRGGKGQGGILVTAQAKAGPGFAQASASCKGSPTCRYRYSAKASAAASFGANRAWASARGSGGGRVGAGMVGVSAQAEAGPGYANAASSCSGASNCRHSYGAIASASARHGGSWARAHAHGSGGGGVGGGGIGVTAQAQAGPGWAQASASCSGARNCSTSYKAHAETSASQRVGNGVWRAHGEGTCSGSGRDGCGVQAFAQPGPGGGGGATCTGDCSHFTKSGGNNFTPDKPAPKGMAYDKNGRLIAVDQNGKPIPMGPIVSEVSGKKDALGRPVLTVKSPQDKKALTKPCLTIPCSVESHGYTVGFDSKTGFTGGTPRKDKVNGSDAIQLVGDARGNAQGSVKGTGWVQDGRTGDKAVFDHAATGKRAHTFTLSNAKTGTGFVATCVGGCEWTGGKQPKLKGVDQLKDATGDTVTIIGRDSYGNPAIVKAVTGRFTTAEGLKYANTTAGQGHLFQVVTPDRKGLGGVFNCFGTCSRIDPRSAKAPAGNAGAPFACRLCHVTEMLRTGPARDQAGVLLVTNYDKDPNSKVTSNTAEGDRQYCVGSGCSFTQFKNDAHGQGGGAVCHGGSGPSFCVGTNRIGETSSCSTQGLGCGALLLYRKARTDWVGGYSSWSADGGADGSGRKLPWQDPTNPQSEIYNGDRDTRFDAQFDHRDDVRVASDTRVALPAQLVADRARLGFSQDRSLLEAAREHHVDEVVPAVRDALQILDKKGPITSDDLKKVREALQPVQGWVGDSKTKQGEVLRSHLAEMSEAANRLAPYTVLGWSPDELDDRAEKQAENPRTVAKVLGKTYDPRTPPTDAERKLAAEEIMRKQGALRSAFDPTPAETGLDQAITAYNRDVVASNVRGGATPKEKAAFDKRAQQLNLRSTQLQRARNDRIEAANAGLRAIDPGFSDVYGSAYSKDLSDANGYLNQLKSKVGQLRGSKDKNTKTAVTQLAPFEDLAKVNYVAVRDQLIMDKDFRVEARDFNGMQLPSTGLPDTVTALQGSIVLPRMNREFTAPNSRMRDVWAEMSPDDRATSAAYATDLTNVLSYQPATFEHTYMSDPGGVRHAIDLAVRRQSKERGDTTVPDVDGAGYAAWFAHGFDRPADWGSWTKDLPGNGAELEGDYKELRQSWDEALADNVRGFGSRHSDVALAVMSVLPETKGIALLAVSSTDRRKDFADTTGNLVAAPIDLVRAAVHEQRAFLGAELKLASGDVGGAVKHLLGDSFNGPGTSFVSQHPLIGGLAVTVGHTLGRIADPHKAVQDYKHKPFSTFMEDITIPSIVLPIAAGAASARAAAMATRAGVAAGDAGVSAGLAAGVARGVLKEPPGLNAVQRAGLAESSSLVARSDALARTAGRLKVAGEVFNAPYTAVFGAYLLPFRAVVGTAKWAVGKDAATLAREQAKVARKRVLPGGRLTRPSVQLRISDPRLADPRLRAETGTHDVPGPPVTVTGKVGPDGVVTFTGGEQLTRPPGPGSGRPASTEKGARPQVNAPVEDVQHGPVRRLPANVSKVVQKGVGLIGAVGLVAGFLFPDVRPGGVVEGGRPAAVVQTIDSAKAKTRPAKIDPKAGRDAPAQRHDTGRGDRPVTAQPPVDRGAPRIVPGSKPLAPPVLYAASPLFRVLVWSRDIYLTGGGHVAGGNVRTTSPGYRIGAMPSTRTLRSNIEHSLDRVKLRIEIRRAVLEDLRQQETDAGAFAEELESRVRKLELQHADLLRMQNPHIKWTEPRHNQPTSWQRREAAVQAAVRAELDQLRAEAAAARQRVAGLQSMITRFRAIEMPTRPGGGPARESGADLTAEQRNAMSELLSEVSGTEVLTPEQITEFFDVPLSAVEDAGCTGICVVQGLSNDVAEWTGVDDLVMYADGETGLIYVDAGIMDALRSGVLDEDALRALGRHELAELHNAWLPAGERLPHEQLPRLPDLTPLGTWRRAKERLDAGETVAIEDLGPWFAANYEFYRAGDERRIRRRSNKADEALHPSLAQAGPGQVRLPDLMRARYDASKPALLLDRDSLVGEWLGTADTLADGRRHRSQMIKNWKGSGNSAALKRGYHTQSNVGEALGTVAGEHALRILTRALEDLGYRVEEFVRDLSIDDTRGGPRRFDRILLFTGRNGTIAEIIVLEEKGPSAALGSSQIPGDTVRYEQGRVEYLRWVATHMKARGGDEAVMADQLLAALADGRVRYLKAQAITTPGETYGGALLREFDIGGAPAGSVGTAPRPASSTGEQGRAARDGAAKPARDQRGAISTLLMAGAALLAPLAGAAFAILGWPVALAATVLGLGTAAVVAAIRRSGILTRVRGPPAVQAVWQHLSGSVRSIGARTVVPASTVGRTVAGIVGAVLMLAGTTVGIVVVTAPPAAGTAAVQPAKVTSLHVVPGDSLYGLARALGVTPRELAAANPHVWPTRATWNRLPAGQHLNLPISWGGTWRARRGESLWVIAARFDLPGGWTSLAERNRATVTDPDVIEIGQRLVIRGATTPTTEPTQNPTQKRTVHPSTPPTKSATPTLGSNTSVTGSPIDWTPLKWAGGVLAGVGALFGGIRALRAMRTRAHPLVAAAAKQQNTPPATGTAGTVLKAVLDGAAGGMSVDELAAVVGARPAEVETVLDQLVATTVLERDGAGYRLAGTARTALEGAAPELRAAIEEELLPRAEDPTAAADLVRSVTRPTGRWKRTATAARGLVTVLRHAVVVVRAHTAAERTRRRVVASLSDEQRGWIAWFAAASSADLVDRISGLGASLVGAIVDGVVPVEPPTVAGAAGIEDALRATVAALESAVPVVASARSGMRKLAVARDALEDATRAAVGAVAAGGVRRVRSVGTGGVVRPDILVRVLRRVADVPQMRIARIGVRIAQQRPGQRITAALGEYGPRLGRSGLLLGAVLVSGGTAVLGVPGMVAALLGGAVITGSARLHPIRGPPAALVAAVVGGGAALVGLFPGEPVQLALLLGNLGALLGDRVVPDGLHEWIGVPPGARMFAIPVTVTLVFRAVQQRSAARRDQGYEVHERRDSVASAVAVAVATTGYLFFLGADGIRQLVAAAAMAVAAGVAVSAVQKKTTGRGRVAGALAAGVTSMLTTLLGRWIGVSAETTGWQLFLDLAAIGGAGFGLSILADLSIAVFAQWRFGLVAARERAEPASTPAMIRRRLTRSLLDWSFAKSLDPRVLWWRLDPLVNRLLVQLVALSTGGWQGQVLMAALAEWIAVLSNRLRDRHAVATGSYGDVSSRPMRDPVRGGAPASELVRAALADLGIRADRPLTDLTRQERDELAEHIAGALVPALDDVVTRLPEWMRDYPSPHIAAIVARLTELAVRRAELHAVTVAHAVLLIERDLIRSSSHGELHHLLTGILTHLRAHPALQELIAAGASGWGARTVSVIEEGDELRAEYHRLFHLLLLDLRRELGHRDPRLLDLLDDIQRIEQDEARDEQRATDPDALTAVVHRLDQRLKSIDGRSGPSLGEHRRVLALLHATALLANEQRLGRAARQTARTELLRRIAAHHSAAAPLIDATAPLLLLVSVAASVLPVTAADLADVAGRTEQDRQSALTALAAAGLIEGDAETGYRGTNRLRVAWRDADPRLRHVLLTAPAELDPYLELLRSGTASPAELSMAGHVLQDVLDEGNTVLRGYRDGHRYDLAGLRNRVRALVLRSRHGAVGAGGIVPHRYREDQGSVERLWAEIVEEPWDAVRSAKAQLAKIRRLAGGSESTLLIRVASADLAVALGGLAEARARFATAMDRRGVYRHVHYRELDRIDAVLGAERGGDIPVEANVLLKQVVKALRSALRGLRAERTEESITAAERALDAHVAVSALVIETITWRPMWNWRMHGVAWKLAVEMAELVAVTPVATAAPAAASEVPSSPDVPRAEISSPAQLAASTVPAPGAATNQDAAAYGQSGDVRFVAVADGLADGHAGDSPATVAVRAAISSLNSSTGPIEVRLQTAQRESEAEVAGPAKDGHTPATTLTIAAVAPTGTPGDHVVTVVSTGNTRAYWLPAGSSQSTLLTRDHAIGDRLTSWLAADIEPAVDTVSRTVTGAGTLLVATDGLWRQVDLGTVIGADGRIDALSAVQSAQAAASTTGRADDRTAAAITITAQLGSTGGQTMAGQAATPNPSTPAPAGGQPAAPSSGQVFSTTPGTGPAVLSFVLLDDAAQVAVEQGLRTLLPGVPAVQRSVGAVSARGQPVLRFGEELVEISERALPDVLVRQGVARDEAVRIVDALVAYAVVDGAVMRRAVLRIEAERDRQLGALQHTRARRRAALEAAAESNEGRAASVRAMIAERLDELTELPAADRLVALHDRQAAQLSELDDRIAAGETGRRLLRRRAALAAAVAATDGQLDELGRFVATAPERTLPHGPTPALPTPAGPLGRRLTEVERAWVTAAGERLVQERGPPEGELLLVTQDELIAALRRDGAADPDDLADRTYAVGLVVDGRLVIVLSATQHALLAHLGVLDEVVDHERTFHGPDARTHDEPAHQDDTDQQIELIDERLAGRDEVQLRRRLARGSMRVRLGKALRRPAPVHHVVTPAELPAIGTAPRPPS